MKEVTIEDIIKFVDYFKYKPEVVEVILEDNKEIIDTASLPHQVHLAAVLAEVK